MNRGLRPNASHVFFHYKTGQTAEFALGISNSRQDFNNGKEFLKGKTGQVTNALDNGVFNVGAGISDAGWGMVNKGVNLSTQATPGSLTDTIGNNLNYVGSRVLNVGNTVANNSKDIGLATGGAAVLGAGGLTAAYIAKKRRDQQILKEYDQ